MTATVLAFNSRKQRIAFFLTLCVLVCRSIWKRLGLKFVFQWKWNCRSINMNFHLLQVQHELANNELSCSFIAIPKSVNVKRNNLPKFENCYYPSVIDLSHSQSAGKIDTAIFIHTGLQYCSRPSPVPKSTENISSCAVVVKLCDSLTLNVASIYLQRGPDELNTEWIKSPQDGHDNWLIKLLVVLLMHILLFGKRAVCM